MTSAATNATIPMMTSAIGLADMTKLNAACAAVAICDAIVNAFIAMFATMIAAEKPPMTPAMIKNVVVFSCAHAAIGSNSFNNLCNTGSNAAPIDSLVSSIAIFMPFMRPSNDSAATVAAPPNETANAPVMSSSVDSESITPLSDGSNFVSADVCPLAALPNANVTVSKSLPVAAAMSSAVFISPCATSTEPVERTKFAIAGRNSSSATANARDIPEINSSLLAITSSVAIALVRNCCANKSCAF